LALPARRERIAADAKRRPRDLEPRPMIAGAQPGQILAGKFRVERVLGEGGMGVVLAAHHLHLDKRVALKFLRPEVAANREIVARFSNEARSSGKIQSEHVARVLDVGVLDDGSPYMVMEYLEGTDLAGLIKQRGSLPGPEAIEFVLQACEALAEAHVAGIVHRDLKPANLFLTRRADGSPCVKVLDFGISKAALTGEGAGQVLTQTAAVLGSPNYMAPEQLKSARHVDARTDIWALGIILHELMTGEVAFRADTVPELYVSILQSPPSALRQRLPGAPAALEAVLLHCLEKDPARRFANVGELALALADFAPARAQPSVERIARITGAVRTSRHPDARSHGAQQHTPQHAPSQHAQQHTPSQHAHGGGVAPTLGPSTASSSAGSHHGTPRSHYGAPPHATQPGGGHGARSGYGLQPAPNPYPQPYPQAPAAPKGMAPATIILIILVALIMLGAGGCVLCVCIGAAADGRRHGALDAPARKSPLATTVAQSPFQPRAAWTSVSRGEPHRPPQTAVQNAALARWERKRSRMSAHVARTS
jgi:serine/threonine protein kinase